LDGLPLEVCCNLVASLKDEVGAYKIHDLWDLFGSTAVQKLKDVGAGRVWVDLKLHDIPNTVRLRVNAVAASGADIVTVHASGGIEMMRQAVDCIVGKLEVYAITALTSLSEEEIHLTYGQPSKAAVLRLARLAKMAGVHGVVCSPKEVGFLAKRPELKGLKFIVPGVRSPGVAAGDQERVDTPAGAIEAGATCIVVGRQITEACDQLAAFRAVEAEIAEVLKSMELTARIEGEFRKKK
jgi:orotidine-5'-phosphate decarboxylase